jgi:hypothetical protein
MGGRQQRRHAQRVVADVYVIEMGRLRSVAGSDMDGDTTKMNMYRWK